MSSREHPKHDQAEALTGISANLSATGFTSTADSATSVTKIADTFEVTQDYHPSPATPNLYEVTVTIKNISSGKIGDLRYRRVMDWDVPPTTFNEYVTIHTGGASKVLYSSDDGFASADPLAGPSQLLFSEEATDSGPSDAGSLFDFGFGSLDAGASTSFTLLYGAAGAENDALSSLASAGAEIYSFGQPSSTDGPTLGLPNTFMFGAKGVGGTPVGAPSINSITERINATTPLYKIGLTVDLQGVSCPSTLSVSTGSLAPRSVAVCAAGETAPSSVHVLQPVFDNSGELGQDSEVGVTASINGGPAFRSTIATPPAPIWIGVGDSFTSGHHQTVDSTFCKVTRFTTCHVHANDPSFSWITDGDNSAAAKLNARLGVPADWAMTSDMLGISGAKATDYGKDGQLETMQSDIETHSGSWNVVSFTGGADDAKFADALQSYYLHHPTGKPWDVSTWSKSNCPDSDSVYRRAVAAAPKIGSALEKVMSTASASSASTRFVDVDYPYVVAKGNVCGTNHGTSTGTWHGSNAVVDVLASIHQKLSAPGLTHVDLRAEFNTSSKLSDLQLIRYYGYPHPDASGQHLIAGLAAIAIE